MAIYNVWVGGDSHWNRSYMGELGFMPLTDAQVARWVVEDEDGDLDIESMSERLHRNWGEAPDGEDDFPTSSEVEDGCLGYGAYTDQTFGVSREVDGQDDEVIWTGNYDALSYVEDEDEEDVCPRKSVVSEEPWARFVEAKNEFNYITGVAYNYCYKGGWGCQVELPDEEEFDVRKLIFNVVEVDGLGEVVTSFEYNGVDHFDENDSDGKSNDYYLVHDCAFSSL